MTALPLVRPARLFPLALGLALAAGLVEHGVAAWRADLEPSSGARWIWAAGSYQDGEPAAFFALRDVEVENPDGARMAIAVDESYVLYVNGYRVGSGSYRGGAAMDAYDLAGVLRPGANRILVEARSSRGAGGILAELQLGGRSVGSGGDWRIFRRHAEELFEPGARLADGEPPQVWGRSPTGRWRLEPPARTKPAAFVPGKPRRPRGAARFRQLHPGASWISLPLKRSRFPNLGQQLMFDWGEPVQGFLRLDLRSRTAEPALLFFGLEEPDPQRRPPDAVLLPVPGSSRWADAHARRFRYVTMIGAAPRSFAEVRLTNDALTAEYAPPAPPAGVFGLTPPAAHTAIEERVWRRLGRQARQRR